MAHFAIEEAIKIINRKTDQSLTRRHIARLCETRELQVCFKWRAGNCSLGIADGIRSNDPISETRLIAIRSLNFDRELYLTPSHCHGEDAVFGAIENNSKDPIKMQVVRQFGGKWQMLLIRDVSDQYLYSIDSTYKNGWQLFDSPKYFFEFEREEGASASHTITVDELRITEKSVSAYIAKEKAKPKKEIDKYSPNETKKLVIRLARHIIAKDHAGIVSKVQLARSIIKELKDTEHNKNIKGSDEEDRARNVGNWIKKLKEGEVGCKSNGQNEEMQALISEAITDFPEEIK